MRYNTLLLNREREIYAPWVVELQQADPGVFASKISRANVQQAWILSAVCELGFARASSRLLCVGSYADTAYSALKKRGVPVIGIDPNEGTGTLCDFVGRHFEQLGTFDAVFATSVIEHDSDDVLFMRQAWGFVRPGGVLLLTTDFKHSVVPGDHIAGGNNRFYDCNSLLKLTADLPGFSFLDVPAWGGPLDFSHAGHLYAFAAMGLRKKG